jgi:hypothetical protein
MSTAKEQSSRLKLDIMDTSQIPLDPLLANAGPHRASASVASRRRARTLSFGKDSRPTGLLHWPLMKDDSSDSLRTRRSLDEAYLSLDNQHDAEYECTDDQRGLLSGTPKLATHSWRTSSPAQPTAGLLASFLNMTNAIVGAGKLNINASLSDPVLISNMLR